MMRGDIFFGVFFLALGLASLVLHAAQLAGAEVGWAFRKLAPMQKAFGRGLGTFLHFVGYAVIPVAFGFSLLTGIGL